MSNDRYIILVYDNIIMLGVRGWLEVDRGRFWKMVEFYFDYFFYSIFDRNMVLKHAKWGGMASVP